MTETLTMRCLDPQCLDGPTEDGPMPRWAHEGLLCRRCGTLLEQRLAEVPARRDALRAILNSPLRSRGSGGGRKLPKAEAPPTEFPVEIHDHLTALHATLVSWVLMVAEERGLRGPDRDDDAVLSGWLLSQLHWMLHHGAIGDFADEMRDLARTADGLARVNPLRHRLPAPCPECGAHELTRDDGADHVACGSCGGTWREDAYPWMVRLALDASGGCLTAQEAAERLGVTVGSFRNMVTAGYVRKLGTVDGTARYSTDDVDALTNEGAA